jgi:glycerophosphoryl diester phosphodiesterase
LQNRVIVKSFKQECLYEIKRLSSRIQIATLFKPHPMRVLRPGRNLVKPTLRLKAEEISLHYTLATERILRKAHDANLKTVIWTADHPSWLERAFKFGIYGVITNNPARLVAYRNKYLA